MPNIGDLDQRVTLQARAAGVDSVGQASGAWADVATVWAQARPLSTRELFAAGTTGNIADVEFTIRWRSDVLPSWRVLWRGKPYELAGEPADTDGERRWLVLLCTSGVVKS